VCRLSTRDPRPPAHRQVTRWKKEEEKNKKEKNRRKKTPLAAVTYTE
jgi:hypothetical protein